jgi:hypothetical protein
MLQFSRESAREMSARGNIARWSRWRAAQAATATMGTVLLRVVALATLLAGTAAAGDLPLVRTVFVILMENEPWSSIKGSATAPFINNVLLPQASCCTQYYNQGNYTLSLPSYLWLEAGTAFGINDDQPPSVHHQSTTNHLASLLYRAGVSWKTYQEDITGTVVPLTDAYPYAVRHNGFVYFDDTTGTNNPNYAYGIAHIRPYSELSRDLTNNTVAKYNFITPNVCHDMHDSCAPLSNQILQGDTWLADEIPKILASSAYTNHGAIFITWDDAGVAGVPIGMIVLSPVARGQGYSSSVHYTHSSLLRTIEEIFHVMPLLGDAANATNLSDLFQAAPPLPTNLRIVATSP